MECGSSVEKSTNIYSGHSKFKDYRGWRSATSFALMRAWTATCRAVAISPMAHRMGPEPPSGRDRERDKWRSEATPGILVLLFAKEMAFVSFGQTKERINYSKKILTCRWRGCRLLFAAAGSFALFGGGATDGFGGFGRTVFDEG